LKKLKVLHLSDLHLDARFPALGEHGRSRREELRQALRSAVETAKSQRVDLMLISGDLFEEEGLSNDTLEFVKDQFLQLFHIPIFVSPGDTDYYWRGSPYSSTSWPKNVHIFSESRLRSVDIPILGVAIHGAAHTGPDERTNCLKDFNVTRSDIVNILMIHGSEYSTLPREMRNYFPFTLDDLKRSGAHYAALGHYHDFIHFPLDASDENYLACYPGSPVGLSFNERGPRGVVIAEIGEGGNSVRFVPIEQREMVQEVLDLKEIISSDEVVSAIRKLAEEHSWHDDFVRIILRGEVFPEVDLSIEEVRDQAAPAFHFLCLEDETSSFYDLEKLQKDKSVVGEFVRLMMERIKEAGEDSARKRVLDKALAYGLDAFFLPRMNLR
jgi:DNA repair exonuclease SbcCD nuclease subunit